MKYFYESNPYLSSRIHEKSLAASVQDLKGAAAEPLVQFLHIILNNLSALLVRTYSEEPSRVSSAAFEGMANVVNRVQNLNLLCDKHGRNWTLSCYVQYAFNIPQSQHSKAASKTKGHTITACMGEDLVGCFMQVMLI